MERLHTLLNFLTVYTGLDLKYFIFNFDILTQKNSRKAAEGSLRRLEYAVSGFTLSVNIYGGGSAEASDWKQKVDYEKYFITISNKGEEVHKAQ